MQDVNYAALKDIKEYEGLVIVDISKKKGALWNFARIMIVLLFFPSFIVLMMLVSTPWSKWPLQTTVVFLAIVGLLTFLSHLKLKKHERGVIPALDTFAKDNGWRRWEPTPSMAFLENVGYKLQPSIISGELDGLPFWFYDADPVTGDSSDNPLALISAKVKDAVPTMLVAPSTGILAPVMDQIAANKFNLSPINLEGNYSNSVRVYIPEGSHIDALSYMTPDLMEAIKTRVPAFVIFSENFISVSVVQSEKLNSIRSLFESLRVVVKEVKEKQHIS